MEQSCFFDCSVPLSRENLGDSKQEKFDVKHAPELRPERFQLGVKGLGGSVGAPVIEKIQYPVRMGEHGSRHGIERVKPGLVNLVVPQGELEPGPRDGLARGVDPSQPLYQGERLSDVGIQLEKHGSPLSLFHVPGRRVFKQ